MDVRIRCAALFIAALIVLASACTRGAELHIPTTTSIVFGPVVSERADQVRYAEEPSRANELRMRVFEWTHRVLNDYGTSCDYLGIFLRSWALRPDQRFCQSEWDFESVIEGLGRIRASQCVRTRENFESFEHQFSEVNPTGWDTVYQFYVEEDDQLEAFEAFMTVSGLPSEWERSTEHLLTLTIEDYLKHSDCRDHQAVEYHRWRLGLSCTEGLDYERQIEARSEARELLGMSGDEWLSDYQSPSCLSR